MRDGVKNFLSDNCWAPSLLFPHAIYTNSQPFPYSFIHPYETAGFFEALDQSDDNRNDRFSHMWGCCLHLIKIHSFTLNSLVRENWLDVCLTIWIPFILSFFKPYRGWWWFTIHSEWRMGRDMKYKQDLERFTCCSIHNKQIHVPVYIYEWLEGRMSDPSKYIKG